MFKHAVAHVVALGALAFGSFTGLGCAIDDGTGEDVAELQVEGDELAADQSGAVAPGSDVFEVSQVGASDGVQTSSWGRYCVDQSYASIQYVNPDSCGGYPCQCPGSLTPHNQFSRNHPVNVHYGCGPYYFVKDLWSSNYGWMRADGLRPC